MGIPHPLVITNFTTPRVPGWNPVTPPVVNPGRGSFASLTSFVRLTIYEGSEDPFCKEVDL